jgi:putative membrane protein
MPGVACGVGRKHAARIPKRIGAMTSDPSPPPTREVPFDPSSITRPDPSLRTYYIIVSLCTLVGFPFVIIPYLIRYQTLRYSFDDKGVSMSWGIVFRKEIYLTYRRIQDIHVTRNIIERWMGLAKVAVQTASGASGAEMTIEGIRNPEALRDFLYQQMRGARDDAGDGDERVEGSPDESDELMALLVEIRDEVRRLADACSGGAP